MPASPALPASAGDIPATHDADITPRPSPGRLGDRLDLHLAIWAAFANARIIRERADRESAGRNASRLAS